MLGIDLGIFGDPLQVSVTEPVAPLIGHLVYSAAGKLTLKQMANGTCLIGGGWPSRRRPDGSLALLPASVAANLATATAVVPALAQARIARSWPALVNGAKDWRPLLGEVPGHPGFFVVFFPWMGFTAGPMSARVVADLVLGRKPPVDLARVSALDMSVAGRSVTKNLAEEVTGALGGRGVEDRLRWAGLDHGALVHHHHPVGDLADEAHLVADQDHGHAVGGEAADHVQDLAHQLRIERRGDLVEEQDLGLQGERPGDRHALLLAARELVRIGAELVAEADPRQQRSRQRLDLAACRAS